MTTLTENSAAARAAVDIAPMRIDGRLRIEVLRAVMARFGRVHIPGFLEHPAALETFAAVTAPLPWQMHYNDGENVYDVPVAEFDALPVETRKQVLDAVHARARSGFQYVYDNFALSDCYARGEHLDHPVMRVMEFLRSEPLLQFARAVTGIGRIATVDAQLTRYRPGHFLNLHDDRDDAKGRVAAYVLNLTPGWRTDWGGHLLFPDAQGHIAEGYMPVFNALNLFKVPAPHFVSPVALCAGSARMSITGWFRA